MSTQLLKNIFYYSTSAYAAQLLGLIMNIVVAKLLGPEDFGIWVFIMLILSYGSYTELGVLSATGRDLPKHLGQGNLSLAAKVNSSARYTTLITAVLSSILILSYTYLFQSSSKYTLALQAASILLILQQIYTYHRVVILRSYNNFSELSQQQVLLAIITAILSVVFVYSNGLNGRILAAIVASVVTLGYAIFRNPWSKLPTLDLNITYSQMRVGIPIIISGLIITMLTSIDRLIVLKFLGERNLGYMSLSVMLVSIISIVPQMASQVLQIEFNFLYGNTGRNIMQLKNYVIAPSKILSLFLPVIIGPVFLALPYVVSNFLIEYVPGIRAAQYVTIGIFFYCILGLTDIFLITTGKLKLYICFGLLAIIFNILIDVVLIKLGYGIEGISIGGTLLTYFVYSTIVITYSVSHYIDNLNDWIDFYIILWAPFIYMVTILFLLDYIFDNLLCHYVLSELSFTIIKIIIYSFLYFLFLIVLFKKLNVELPEAFLKRFTKFL